MTVQRHDALEMVALHFDGALGPAGEHEMRAALDDVPEARALYLALMAAEATRPDAEQARHARLEAAIFGPRDEAATRERPSRFWTRRARLFVTALAALLLLGLAALIALPRLRQLAPPPGDRARTKPAGALHPGDRYVRVAVYRVRGDVRAIASDGTIAADDALAFAYNNEGAAAFDRLLLFGVDERLTVYWYYPAYDDPRRPPAAAVVKRGRGIELPQGVRHRYRRGRLRIFAVFTRRRDLDVSRVEALFARLRREGARLQGLERLPLEQTGQHVIDLEVR